MSKILIKEFGPIKLFERDVDEKLMVFIGEQASGKSTIAKTIFYCKSISEELKKYLLNADNLIDLPKNTSMVINFRKSLRTKFMEYFGTTKHMDLFLIEYTFDNDEKISIKLEKEYANILFSSKIRNRCAVLCENVKKYYEEQNNIGIMQSIDLGLLVSERERIVKMISDEVNSIFEQNYTPIFIPAGRSLLATNSEFFHTLTPNKYDILMNDFIERITVLQKQYSQRMEDIVTDKKKFSSESIDFQSVNMATTLVKDILKGEYINDKNGEKIYYKEDKFVKLVQASSGQQESLWIVLLIFSIIVNNQKVYMVIEEPEAHLFPTAQKKILELIILMINATDSKVIITTHSPYILTVTNLLMYSSFVEKEKKTDSDIVSESYRISDGEVSSYLLSRNNVIDIMDRNNHMIDASKIDKVSEILNEATDKLIELEMKNEL